MIYYFDALDDFSEDLCIRLMDTLPPERREKAQRYKRLIDRKLSVLSYLMLAYGLNSEYFITGPIRFGYEDNQKPYLPDYPHVRFNISHCEQCVAVAISGKDIGIDVQNFIDYNESLAKMVCSKRELECLQASERPDHLFIQYWTHKESYLKLTGSGISDDMKKLDFSYATDSKFEQYHCHFQQSRHSGYMMSVCSLEPDLQAKRLSVNFISG